MWPIAAIRPGDLIGCNAVKAAGHLRAASARQSHKIGCKSNFKHGLSRPFRLAVVSRLLAQSMFLEPDSDESECEEHEHESTRDAGVSAHDRFTYARPYDAPPIFCSIQSTRASIDSLAP